METNILYSYYFLGPAGVMSTGCVIIHLYKFFKSKSPQSLATKLLTMYCFLLLLIYITFPIILLDCTFIYDDAIEILIIYLMLAIAVLKFILAVDLCICFRNTSVYLEKMKNSNTKFIVYCIINTVAAVCFTLAEVLLDDEYSRLGNTEVLKMIRVARLVPFFLTLWYIKKSSIDRNILWMSFSFQMRLVVLMGGVSGIIDILEFIITTFFDEVIEYLSIALEVGFIIEGVLVGMYFTFKKDTFKCVSG